jgi:hypothetical protein
MGHSAWLVLIPGVLTLVAFANWLRVASFAAPFDTVVPLTALGICAGFALWGCIGNGQAEANRFGTSVAA